MSSNVIPTLRYRDAPAAVEWLCTAFGFERHTVVEDDAGGIAHAQLSITSSAGKGMIMLGSAHDGDDDFGKFQGAPVDGVPTTQSAYIVVDDVDALCARAEEAGARIVMPLESPEYGGRAFSALDPQGHLWNFGSYDPWAE